MNAYTIYWTPQGWSKLTLGEPIPWAAGNSFSKKIRSGDMVFVTNIQNGKLLLLGGFRVKKIHSVDIDGPLEGVFWESAEYLIPDDHFSYPLEERKVPDEVTRTLRVYNSTGKIQSLKFLPNHQLDGQTLRAIRKLTEESGKALFSVLDGSTKSIPLTDEQLRALLEVYLSTLKSGGGKDALFASIPSILSHIKNLGLNQQPEESLKILMQEISYVFGLMGREWIEEFRPAKSIEPVLAKRIAHILHSVGFGDEVAVRERLEIANQLTKNLSKPDGIANPIVRMTESKIFARCTYVAAWVLTRAAGKCECCGKEAPFTRVDGTPYLEVHHLRRLADGGSDTPSNTIAVCPNCHRQLHYSAESLKLREEMYAKCNFLQPE